MQNVTTENELNDLGLDGLFESTFDENTLTENILVASAQLIYAAQGASGGDGTINNPYGTIAQAMSACAGASPTSPYYIMVVGNFTENVSLLPNVSLVGISPTARINGSVTQASQWNTAASGSNACLMNLSITSLNFSPTPTNQPTIRLINLQVSSTVTLNNNASNILVAYVYDCTFSGTVNIDNAFVYSWSNRYVKPVKIGLNPAFSSVILFSKSDSYYAGAPISVATQGSNTAQLRLVGCEVYSSVSGSNNANIFMDAISYVAPTLMTGATLTLTSVSNGVNANYTPTAYVPTNDSVQGHLQGINNALSSITNTANIVTGTTQTLVSGQNYIAVNPALTTFTLPVTANAGQSMQISGFGSGLFQILQNAGQRIYDGTAQTSLGVGGLFSVNDPFSSINLVCVNANTDFMVTQSQGNFTLT